MILISFIISLVQIASNSEDNLGNPNDNVSLWKCFKDFSIKFSKYWLHTLLVLYKSFNSKMATPIEILVHYGLFCIASVYNDQIKIYGQLAILELASLLIFTFIEVFLLSQVYFYYDQLLAIFFFNVIPSQNTNLIIFGIIHASALILCLRQIFQKSNISCSQVNFDSKKIINIGNYRGKSCILVEKIQPREVQLIELNTQKIIGYTPIPENASLKSYLACNQLIIIQVNHKLDICQLSNFKFIKQYDIDNKNIQTAETVRAEKLDQEKNENFHLKIENDRSSQLSKVYNEQDTNHERQYNQNDFQIVNSNQDAPLVNNTDKNASEKSNKTSDIENQRQNKCEKIYIVHESKPLIAEIELINQESNIRIINFLTNFEERKLVLTIPLFKLEQLIQFIQIDGSDKIFFKSPQNSFCIVDINKNLSDFIKQHAEKEYQCTIINERDMALAGREFIYIYDIPANLFVKKISKFHMYSHIFPICNAPGFYLIIPSEDHSHRLHPIITQLINDQFFSYKLLKNKITSPFDVKSIIYESETEQLYIFTDKQMMTQKNISLQKAEQPQVNDHVVLDVSIYQQAQCDYQ